MEQINKKLVLACVLIMLPLAGSGIDLYTPSLPALQEILQVTTADIKLSVSLYLLGLCFGQIIFGTLSDYIGRKHTIIIGLLGFSVLSILISFSNSLFSLLTLRIVQGFIVGAVAVNARSLVTDSFSKHEIAGVSAYMSLAWSLGPILAPMVGGYIEFYLNWKVSFYVLAAYSLCILFLIFFLKESCKKKSHFHFLTLVKNYKEILTNRIYLGGLFMMSVCFTILIIYATVLPFIIQDVLGKSSIVYGHATFFIGLSYLLGSIVNRSLLRKLDSNKIIVYGVYSVAICSLVMLIVSLIFKMSVISIYVPIFVLTVSVGAVFPGALSKCISLFPEKAGIASAIAGAGFMLLTSISTSITGHIHLHSAIALSVVFLILSAIAVLILKLFLVPKGCSAVALEEK